MKKRLFSFSVFIVFSTMLFSQQLDSFDLNKTYSGNIFSGGSIRILPQSALRDIEIINASIFIDLYDEYSIINADYTIKNNGSRKLITFQYPKVDTEVRRISSNRTENILNTEVISGNYEGFVITVNGNEASYTITDDNSINAILPYKLGNIRINTDPFYREVIESFEHFVNFYSSGIVLEANQTVTVSVKYRSINYFNEVISRNHFEHNRLTDAQLNYIEFKSDESKMSSSERIFYYPFRTVYYSNNLKIKNLNISLRSSVIDPNYLSILPLNYSRRGTRFNYTYKNFVPNEYHTILIKQAQQYSANTVLNSVFHFSREKTGRTADRYFEFGSENNFVEIEFEDEYQDLFIIKGVSLLPYYDGNNTINMPRKISLLFSDNNLFTGPSVYQVRLNSFQISSLIRNRQPIHINIGRIISHNYIKVIFEDFSNNSQHIRIRDIQIRGQQVQAD